MYGIGGELLAEYPAGANPLTTPPQKEYGYRNGQLLITAESGTNSGPAPAGLSAVPSGNNPNPTITLSWSAASGATNYRVERAASKDGPYSFVTATSSTSSIDTSTTNGIAYLYKVCVANSQSNCTSAYSNIALGAAKIFITDPTITGYSETQDPSTATLIRAAHITELRTAVNAVRSLAGRSTISVPNPSLGSPINATDVRDLRDKLGEALNDLGIQPLSYTDPILKGYFENPLGNATPIEAVHIRELRQAATHGIGGSGGSAGLSFQIHWLVADQLGTPRVVFDQSGSLTVTDQNGNYLSGMIRHDYLPFGEELLAGTGGRTQAQGYSASDGVRQHFTQKERDNETGLDYFGERYYGSTMGRFITVDPLGSSAKRVDPQSMNRYSYALNNPLRYVDPDGLDSWDDLSKKEQALVREKLVLQKGQTYRDRFDQLVAVKGDEKATAANTQSVKLFLGAVAKTEAWQQIKSIERVDSNGVNSKGESYTSTIGLNVNREGFLNALGAQDYNVNGGGDEARKAAQTASRNVVPFLVSLVVPGFPSVINSPDHPYDNARASTMLESDPQLHFYNEHGGDFFQAHWDPTSSGAVTQGPIGHLSGGMGHGVPGTVNQVNDYLKRTQKTPQ